MLMIAYLQKRKQMKEMEGEWRSEKKGGGEETRGSEHKEPNWFTLLIWILVHIY